MFFGFTREQLLSHARSAAKILGTVAVMFGIQDTTIISATSDNAMTIFGSLLTLWGLWSSHAANA